MSMTWIEGGVTAAAGFVASGAHAGIKRRRKPDLALVAAERTATAAGVLTRNRIQAAPVHLSRARLAAGTAQAVLINSGCANCLTGRAGRADAASLSRAVAQALGMPERQILVASTGLIGTRLPVARVRRAIPRLVAHLSRQGHAEAARAILTTDCGPKEAAVEAVIAGRRVRLGGMAKGAGMIAPSMATMLCVLTTDAAVAPPLLRRLLRQATEETFNRISVDGDMSTNDTVFALASGASGVTVRPGSRDAGRFAAMLRAVAGRLSHAIVQDGEGASRVMEICVTGARTAREAQVCARRVAVSPLVKTMLAGGDPNVGRIAAAAGASAARFDARRLAVWIGDQRLIGQGAVQAVSARRLRRLLKHPEVTVRIDLGAGRGAGRMLTCDLTAAYVRLNARYAT
jgi:glutamate N-acetyltransferase/amino-acid N-acetyltransferase